uniref:Uncharacterized protein n=1 Tax=Arundo donax TaxID=35708 RepID=A0A0A9C9N0_ARUDO
MSSRAVTFYFFGGIFLSPGLCGAGDFTDGTKNITGEEPIEGRRRWRWR